ncbi:MAG: hypothetical protein ACRD43_02865, partial [Pyrinomonadaceae bacterium]
MLVAALIITQSQLYKGFTFQTVGYLINESLDIFRHEALKVAQMESDKNSITATQFAESVAYLLRETFAGSPDGQPSAYLDRGVGLFSTLEGLSADEASHGIADMTIAAQTEHAKFYLDRLCEFINGRTASVNWDDSWLIETVNEPEWSALRA